MSKQIKPNYITPNLESITVRGKYLIKETNFNVVSQKVLEILGRAHGWKIYPVHGESVTMVLMGTKKWTKNVKEMRSGAPIYFSVIAVERLRDSIIVEVECRPTLWFKIATLKESNFTENDVQESLLECRIFVKQVMSGFRGKEVEPISVYPIIQRTEIKSRLLNLGLRRIVTLLDKAEKHIVQNNFTDSLKSSRTAFEKMVDRQMKKRGLEKTNNYKNDLARIESKGYLDSETTKLIQTYYRCLSNIAVHEKGEVEPGIFEAQMGYGITLIMLDYFAHKLP
jgi:hypothetical protein